MCMTLPRSTIRFAYPSITARHGLSLSIGWLSSLSATPLAVASPDIGGIKRAQLFREHLEKRLGRAVEFLFMEKRRAAGHVSGQQIVGHAAGRHVLLVDDLCATGETLLRAAASFHDAGALRVSAAITHVASAEGLRALCANRYLSQVVVTDSALTPEAENAGLGARQTLCQALRFVVQSMLGSARIPITSRLARV